MGLRTFIDLFCGIGGFHAALSAEGLKCVAACDKDKHVRAAYADNWGVQPLGDITMLRASAFPAADVICAGFPCQTFSTAGSRLGISVKQGLLFRHVARIAEGVKSSLVLLENVPGFATANDGKAERLLEASMNAAGYAVTRTTVNLADCGRPARRVRLFYVCLRRGSGLAFSPPAPQRDVMAMRDFVGDWAANPLVPSDWRFGWLDRPGLLSPEQMPPGKVLRVGFTRLKCGADDAPSTWPGAGRAVYCAHGHAPCFTSGRSAHRKSGIYLFPDRSIRMLSISAALHLMSFPPDFVLPQCERSFAQLGNAVAPAAVRRVFRGICRHP